MRVPVEDVVDKGRQLVVRAVTAGRGPGRTACRRRQAHGGAPTIYAEHQDTSGPAERCRQPTAWWPARGRLWAAALALLLSGTARGEPAAVATDPARLGVVSFSTSRRLVLLDGQSGERRGTLAASSVPRELELSGNGQLFLVEESLVERIDLAKPVERSQLWIYASRTMG